MKIDTIYHPIGDRRKERKGDAGMRRYNKDPIYHPMMLEREYTRALNATKMERMFAKPFVASFGQRGEGIWCIAKDSALSTFAAASYDNKITIWNIHTRKLLSEQKFDEKILSLAYSANTGLYVAQNECVINRNSKYTANSLINSVDLLGNTIASGTAKGVSLFEIDRYSPTNVYEKRGVSKVKLNSSFKHTMAAATQHGVSLYDNRVGKEYASIDGLGVNCVEFNPSQGFTLATGNEDGNTLIYDMRELTKPLNTLRGHVGPVVSLSYNPNGKEIATGSFDHTIRIFDVHGRKSRDCYYNDRMHIVHGLTHSNDGQFLVSGSDDGSIRLWKAQAARRTGPVSRHEKDAIEYREALKDKFKNVAEIQRISKHRFLPRELRHKMRAKHESHEAALRKEARIKAERTNPENEKFYEI